MMYSPFNSLLNSRASLPQRGFALVLAVLIGMMGVMTSPFGSQPMAINTAFIPVLLTALLMAKGLTAYLLFLHFFSVRRISMGVLASVYLYIACFTAMNLLYLNDTYLDLRWFWILWHGFSEPGICLAMLCHARFDEHRLTRASMRRALWPLFLVPVVTAHLLLVLNLSGHLPVIGAMSMRHFSALNLLELMVWFSSFAALAAIIIVTRLRSVLHLWLAFVVYVTLINSSITLFGSSIPYSLGWYSANISSIVSALVLLYVLLSELNHIFSHIQFTNNMLWNKSMRDGLTGLFNRRYLDEQLEVEIQRMHRSGSPLAVILVDIDFFKRINDTHGHQTGDLCLAHIARILEIVVRRPADFVARYGGEEFVAVLPDTTAEGARDRAEAARRLVEQTPLDGSVRVTISAGVACSQEGGVGTEEGRLPLMQQADTALYAAKKLGRNQVQLYLTQDD